MSEKTDVLKIVVDENGYTGVFYKGTELNVKSINLTASVDEAMCLNCEIIIPAALGHIRKVNVGEKKE